LEELKEVRNRQKSLLKPGYHKIFIDRVWDRMHNGPSEAVTIPAESSDNNTKRDNNNQMSTVSSAAVSPRDELSALMKTSPSSLVKDDDRSLTTDLTFFTLLQVEAYSMLGAGSLDENSREIGFPGLVCTHCKVRKFFTTSGEHLSGLLVTISNHMQTCQSCPKLVRSQITQFRGTHDSQLRRITSESHEMCMENVWTRLVKASRKEKRKSRVQKPVEIEENVLYLPLDQSKPLVTSEDEHLVTEFTYFTMQQVRPCNLDRSENGSRSQFADGFPGLECIHCADTLQSRKFFYRTLEILAGKCCVCVQKYQADSEFHHCSLTIFCFAPKVTMPTFPIILTGAPDALPMSRLLSHRRRKSIYVSSTNWIEDLNDNSFNASGTGELKVPVSVHL
jgi:hypothetical protein